jgi:hypothetical protein
MVIRECPFCGKRILGHAAQCAYCRETLPPTPRVNRESPNDGGGDIRRGLLFMLLAALLGYFAGGYSSLKLPILAMPLLNIYLAPLLFLSGCGLAGRGFYLKHRATPRHHSV